jgi:hypothetical protein
MVLSKPYLFRGPRCRATTVGELFSPRRQGRMLHLVSWPHKDNENPLDGRPAWLASTVEFPGFLRFVAGAALDGMVPDRTLGGSLLLAKHPSA